MFKFKEIKYFGRRSIWLLNIVKGFKIKVFRYVY